MLVILYDILYVCVKYYGIFNIVIIFLYVYSYY